LSRPAHLHLAAPLRAVGHSYEQLRYFRRRFVAVARRLIGQRIGARYRKPTSRLPKFSSAHAAAPLVACNDLFVGQHIRCIANL